MAGHLRDVWGIALLIAVALGALVLTRVRLRGAVVTAVARAAVQLALVGLVVRAVFSYPWLVAAMLGVMLAIAGITTRGRIRGLENALPAVLGASIVGVGLAAGIVFAVPVLPRSTRYVIALSGITVGGTMTACTLAGRAFLASMRTRRDEIEGWLSIGASMREACADLVRAALVDALVPVLDQTRTVGLVTLPGTFAGALLAGASAADAARFQLVLLVALLAAETVAATLLLWILGAPRTLPAM